MKKTMIYLNDDQYNLLKEEAEETHAGMAAIIRDAVSLYFKAKKKKMNYFSFVGIAEGSRKGNTSEKVEEILKEIMR